jgi:MFS family permease
MNIALPHIIAVFNVPTDHAQLVISAYLMATAITTPAAAFLCSRFGTKRVFLLSQASFLFGSILCGISWNADSLIVFRILQGLAGGLLSPIAMTLLFLNVPVNQRGTAMAWSNPWRFSSNRSLLAHVFLRKRARGTCSHCAGPGLDTRDSEYAGWL